MRTKLTLRLERQLIRRAKAFARREGKSVSQLVAEYFALLGGAEQSNQKLPPLTRSLRGVLRDARVHEAEFRRHLEKKHS